MNLTARIILLLLLVSCGNEMDNYTSSSGNHSSHEDTVNEGWLRFDDKKFDIPLGKVLYDTLTLSARFDECGEWGGHKEMFVIYSSENHELLLDYTQDTVDCSKPYAKESRVVVVEKSQVLSEDAQKVIVEYLQNLVEESLKFNLGSHAGRYYSASTKDTSFIVTYHDDSDQWQEYEKMKKKVLK